MDVQEIIMFRREDYDGAINSALKSMFVEGWPTDVTLLCRGQKFETHKIILGACSPFLRSVIKDNPGPNTTLLFYDLKPSILKYIVDYMYEGVVSVGKADRDFFLRAIDDYKIQGLTTFVNEFLKETTCLNTNAETKSKYSSLTESAFENSEKDCRPPFKMFKELTKTSPLQSINGINEKDQVDNEPLGGLIELVQVKSEPPIEEPLGRVNGESAEEFNELVQVIGESTEEFNELVQVIGESTEEFNELVQVIGESTEEFNELELVQVIGESTEEFNELVQVKSETLNQVDESKVKIEFTDIAQVKTDHLCPICGKAYFNKFSARRHLKLHQEKRNDFKCDVCQKLFKWRGSMLLHRKRIHGWLK